MLRTFTTILVLGILGAALPAAAQQRTKCNPETFRADADTFPEGVADNAKPTLLRPDGTAIPADVSLNSARREFSVSAGTIALQPDLRLQWPLVAGGTCEQTAAGQGSTPTARIPAASQADCARAGVAATQEARRARGQDDFTVLLFNDLGVCYANRHFSTEGDPLFVGYARSDGSVAVLEFDKCEAASAVPKVLVGGDISAISPQSTGPPKFEVQWFMPVAQCFGTSVQLHLDKTGQEKFVSATITQYERYRATLQVGAVFTERHIQSFGLRTDGDRKFLVETGPGEQRGPEYVASVVIYGLPHYLRRRRVLDPSFVPGAATSGPRKDPYYGRDPVNENGAMDRFGALMGVGLSQPGRRLVLGATFELVTGVNLFGVREFVRQTLLNDAEVGDEFVGEAKDISLREDWESGWSFGISFDARYAVALFGKK